MECGKELDLEHMSKLEKYDDRIKYLEDFSRKITPINNKLMEESDCLIAILDGGHTVDDGVASEIGYWAGAKRDGPIFALRSDIRCGENIAVSINPQIIGYISLSGGYLADGPGAVDKFFTKVREWAVSKQQQYDSQKQ